MSEDRLNKNKKDSAVIHALSICEKKFTTKCIQLLSIVRNRYVKYLKESPYKKEKYQPHINEINQHIKKFNIS